MPKAAHTHNTPLARAAREVVHLGKRIIYEMNANGGNFPDSKAAIIDRRARLEERVVELEAATMAELVLKAAAIRDCSCHDYSPESSLAIDVLRLCGREVRL